MKKLYIFAVLIFVSNSFQLFSQQPAYFMVPQEKTVPTGSIVTINVMFGIQGDSAGTITAPPASISNWKVNGAVSEDLIIGPSFATYMFRTGCRLRIRWQLAVKF